MTSAAVRSDSPPSGARCCTRCCTTLPRLGGLPGPGDVVAGTAEQPGGAHPAWRAGRNHVGRHAADHGQPRRHDRQLPHPVGRSQASTPFTSDRTDQPAATSNSSFIGTGPEAAAAARSAEGRAGRERPHQRWGRRRVAVWRLDPRRAPRSRRRRCRHHPGRRQRWRRRAQPRCRAGVGGQRTAAGRLSSCGGRGG